MRSHAEKHGLSEELSRRREAERTAGRMENFFPAAPHLNAAQTAELDVKLVIALANDGRPFSLFGKHVVGLHDDRAAHTDATLAHYGLREWLQLLHPGYTVPSRPTT